VSFLIVITNVKEIGKTMLQINKASTWVLLHVETARGVKSNASLHIKKITEGLQVKRKELKVKSI